MTGHTSIVLDVPRAWWITSNGRYHWADKARRTRWIRQAATIAARGIPPHQRVHVNAYIAFPRNGRADADNAHPTVKACLDGVVDAGVLPDDDSEHVTAITYRRDAPTGRTGMYRLQLVLTEEKP